MVVLTFFFNNLEKYMSLSMGRMTSHILWKKTCSKPWNRLVGGLSFKGYQLNIKFEELNRTDSDRFACILLRYQPPVVNKVLWCQHIFFGWSYAIPSSWSHSWVTTCLDWANGCETCAWQWYSSSGQARPNTWRANIGKLWNHGN